jgi:hypothetical protein
MAVLPSMTPVIVSGGPYDWVANQYPFGGKCYVSRPMKMVDDVPTVCEPEEEELLDYYEVRPVTALTMKVVSGALVSEEILTSEIVFVESEFVSAMV